MAKLSDFKRDSLLIEDGQWVENIPGAGKGVRIFTRGMDCVDAISLRAELELNRPMEITRDVGDSAIEDIKDNAHIIAHVCAKKVEGISDFAIPEDPDTFENLLNDPDYKSLLSLFLVASRMVGRLNSQKKEELTKN